MWHGGGGGLSYLEYKYGDAMLHLGVTGLLFHRHIHYTM